MSTVTDVAGHDYRALAEFRYQIRRFLHFSEEVARRAGLEPQQHQLLLALKGLPGGLEPTIGVLSERVQIQHHSLVELVNRLVARGLAARERDQIDRRKVLVRLTAQGEEVLRELSGYHETELRTVGPHLLRALEAVLARDSGPAAM